MFHSYGSLEGILDVHQLETHQDPSRYPAATARVAVQAETKAAAGESSTRATDRCLGGTGI